MSSTRDTKEPSATFTPGSLSALQQPTGDSYFIARADGVIAGSANTGSIGDLSTAKANAELWSAAPELYAALKTLFDLIDNGRLVRDTSHDHEEGWAMKQLDIVMSLQKVQAALRKAAAK